MYSCCEANTRQFHPSQKRRLVACTLELHFPPLIHLPMFRLSSKSPNTNNSLEVFKYTSFPHGHTHGNTYLKYMILSSYFSKKLSFHSPLSIQKTQPINYHEGIKPNEFQKLITEKEKPNHRNL